MTSRLTNSFWHTSYSSNSPQEVMGEMSEDTVYDAPAAFRELLLQYCQQLDAQPVDELTLSSAGLPISVYLPENYEPNYAYPLVIWLHGDGGSEEDIQLLMPLVSDRNHIGMAIRAPWDSWSEAAYADTHSFESDLHATVCRIRSQYHIHSERIFLAGFGSGATMAMRTLLDRPEWFAGAAMLGGQIPSSPYPLAKLHDLRGKRIYWAAGETDPSINADSTGRALRLLHVAGLQTTVRTFDGGHQIVEGMLSGLNHWIMQGISSATLV
jgi:phospholipase/carboxylesterase